ncbi:uncharacterized protein M421DRAFT_69272 [Didymella exigua CBS 183.55]|uniref:Uncharacterized protein n=1 Tax=Didymella exigua CBS 183.55 TaxID=1150837 RepID=A0A6A5RGW5_9PLEO|nr:uncharacterized protein M421DRAFT_69272 [Didymella exigua CBS 183.55]KAF1925726.1 hypothetical protein M421DRAFT_69272 [Didymella exigua CBS 183.55]
MCKVVKHWYACRHGFRLQHSKCGGTKHKNTRTGLTTACRSEAYLNFVFAVACGPCQYQAFEGGWKRKLRLAEIFLGRLKEMRFPGVQEVNALVEQLKDEFNTATWNTRTLFPHAPKEHTVRVSLGHFKKAPSPLRREVLPEDIPEQSKVNGPDHPDYKYDYGYIESTDPLHPVDIKYTHPLNGVDASWMLNHFSPEEFEQSGGDVGFDANEVDTAWVGSLEEDTELRHSVRSFYDKWRRRISQIKDVDRAKYDKELLFLSRCEIKDVERPNGRFVLDPQRPQDGGAKTGWCK